jgi:hypothetical protein
MGKEEWAKRGSSGLLYLVEIERKRPQACGSPARNSAVFAGASSGEAKGRGRGRPGLFVGEAWGEETAGN